MTNHLHSFTLADLVREQAKTLPDARALVEAGRTLTYFEVDERTDAIARAMADRGVGIRSRVVWAGPDDSDAVLTMLAAAKLGAHTVPLNWRASSDEVATMLTIANPALVVTTPNPRADSPVETSLPLLDLTGVPSGRVRPGVIQEDDARPALGFFTAAWTGTPRLALLAHRGIVTQSLVLGAYGEVNPRQETYLASGPLFHVGPLLKLFANLLFGNTVVLEPSGAAEAICGAIERESVTSAYLFTPTIDQIVTANAAGRWDLSSLRLTPAAPSPAASDWYQMTSCDPADTAWPMGYGQTETWGMVSLGARGPRSVATHGRPSPVAVVDILDRDSNARRPDEAGEIVVRGPQVMLGYADDLDPCRAAHRTGDLGLRDRDGGVEFLGPLQEAIKTGMENVYPAEVEAVLHRHEGIAEACVVGVSDATWGHAVGAAVEIVPGGSVTPAEVTAYVRSHIASYKKPRTVVVVNALPRTDGQIDREAVRALVSQAHRGS